MQLVQSHGALVVNKQDEGCRQAKDIPVTAETFRMGISTDNLVAAFIPPAGVGLVGAAIDNKTCWSRQHRHFSCGRASPHLPPGSPLLAQ